MESKKLARSNSSCQEDSVTTPSSKRMKTAADTTPTIGSFKKEKREKGVNVQVAVRCRPFNEREMKANLPQMIFCNEQRQQVSLLQSTPTKQTDQKFTFDKVFGPDSQQKHIYDEVVRPIISEVMEGYNCTIFAYGQTGTGKTYTMEGEWKESMKEGGELSDDAGVIPRAVRQIFDTLEAQNAEYSMKVQFIELYNEEITDLLATEEERGVVTPIERRTRTPTPTVTPVEPKTRTLTPTLTSIKRKIMTPTSTTTPVELKIGTPTSTLTSTPLPSPTPSPCGRDQEGRTKVKGHKYKSKNSISLMEDGKGSVFVRGIEGEIVITAEEIYSLLERGSSRRQTAETLLNKQSSRSHSIFTITIYIKEVTPGGGEVMKCGKLNLVDLAGSENVSRAGGGDKRAREAGEINKSLLTLGRVINALVEDLGHVPYRDSKLTRLLRDSLGGKTKTCIIATVSPSVTCMEETLSTLEYAHRAKSISNKPEVNQKISKAALIEDLYSEIDVLKEKYHITEQEMEERFKRMSTEMEEKDRRIKELQAFTERELEERFKHLSSEMEAKDKRIMELEKLLSLELCDRLEMMQKNLDVFEQVEASSTGRKSHVSPPVLGCLPKRGRKNVRVNHTEPRDVSMDCGLDIALQSARASFSAEFIQLQRIVYEQIEGVSRLASRCKEGEPLKEALRWIPGRSMVMGSVLFVVAFARTFLSDSK